MKPLSKITHIGILLILIIIVSFSKEQRPEVSGASPEITVDYTDGIYDGESQANYTQEHFWGHVSITIENNLFTAIDFSIRDSVNHEIVDSMYGVIHYSSIPAYMQQCVNEDHAIKIYPQQLLQKQDIKEVDCISGATWSYNIFVASTMQAVYKAIPSGIDEKVIEKNEVVINFSPNPFNSRVTMEYNLIRRSYINVSIYDNLGRLTKQLVDEPQLAGKHVVEWNDCPSEGIYYCRMQLDDKMVCNKIVKAE